jgi:Domain of unknown function (DUF4160)
MSDAMLQVLGFHRINNLSRIEQFEQFLASFLDSGAYIQFDDGVRVLLFGRQLVERIRGMRIEIFPREHAPPHFHVKGGDVDAAFTLSDCTFLHGTISRRDEDLVRFWYAKAGERLATKGGPPALPGRQ